MHPSLDWLIAIIDYVDRIRNKPSRCAGRLRRYGMIWCGSMADLISCNDQPLRTHACMSVLLYIYIRTYCMYVRIRISINLRNNQPALLALSRSEQIELFQLLSSSTFTIHNSDQTTTSSLLAHCPCCNYKYTHACVWQMDGMHACQHRGLTFS